MTKRRLGALPDYRRAGWNQAKWTRAVIALGYLAGFIPLGLLLQTNAVAAILLFVGVGVGSALLIRLALYYLFVAPILARRR